MKKISIAVTLFFMVLSIGIFCMALTFPGKSNGAMGPGFFPIIIAVIVFFLSILSLIKTRKEKDDNIPFFTKSNAIVFLSLLITGIYVVMIGVIGFIPATLLFLFGMMKFFKMKGYVLPVLLSVCTTGILYAVFTMFLYVQLPHGLIFS